MFLYEKKVIYLSCYRNGNREGTAGFIKAVREKNAYTLDIHIRSELKELNGTYEIVLILGGREAAWEKIDINGGSATVCRQIKLLEEMLCIGKEVYKEEELYEIRLMIDEQTWIAGNFGNKEKEAPRGIDESTKNTEEEINLHAADKETSPVLNTQNDFLKREKIKIECPIFENKWEQLQQNYQTVHPFGDQRIFLSIEPKDFVVLREPFQKLVNNSFLLHGFYNYRHLILGPDKELGGEGKIRFYLGVPGTYFEREKMVAVMFGFEGFECAGEVEVGKFGYYMRRVEL